MAVVGKADKVAKNFFQQNRCQAINRQNTGDFDAERHTFAAQGRQERQRYAKSCRWIKLRCSVYKATATVAALEHENRVHSVRFKFSFCHIQLDGAISLIACSLRKTRSQPV
jgi:hypothetical protein